MRVKPPVDEPFGTGRLPLSPVQAMKAERERVVMLLRAQGAQEWADKIERGEHWENR